MSLSIAEAAERLGLHRSRVEQMLWAGHLSGRKSGRLWLIDEESVAAARVHRPAAGRPMAPSRAWALLDLLDGGSAEWLAPVARSQVRAKLSELNDADAAQWRALLRARRRVVRVRVHSSAINRIVKSLGADVAVGGSARAIALGADIVDLDPMPELYVRSERWPEVAQRWHMHEVASIANLRVHLPRDVWIFGSSVEAPPAPIAADLLESAEPRSVEAGLAMLRDLVKKHHAASAVPRSR